MIESVVEVCAKNGGMSLTKKASVILAALHATECGVPITEIESFCRVVNYGFSSGDSQSSAIVIRNMLIASRGASKSRIQALREANAVEHGIKDFVIGLERKRQYTDAEGVYANILKSRLGVVR